jgi:OmpA-OmpF porin, OOP family
MNAKQIIATGIVTAMLGLGPTVASAQEGPYFGLFWGKGRTDVDKSDLDAIAVNLATGAGGTNTAGASSLNDTDSVWGAQVGYRFNRFVAAEIGYVDLGKTNYTSELDANFGTPVLVGFDVDQRLLSSGPTVAALGMFPIGQRFDVYGRAGIYFADTRYRIKVQFVGDPEIISSEEKAGTQEFFGGFGFAWNINESYALRTELTYFNDVGDDDRTGETSSTLITLGVQFR